MWAAAGTGIRQFQIRLNGATVVGSSIPPLASIGYAGITAAPFRASAGDIVTVIAYQDSGGALNVIGASFPCLFKAARVGA
jgi:hypothetical protein